MIRIMLVEDDDTIAFGIRSALGRKGYDVICCPDMEQGKQSFSPEIRLILLDLNLPDGSGYDFCRWVKKQRDTPVMFLTVREEAQDIIRGLDMGADDYITKPFHLSVLESRIHAVLRRVSKSGRTEEEKDGQKGRAAGELTAKKETGGLTSEAGRDRGENHTLKCGQVSLDKKAMKVRVNGSEVVLTGLEYRLLLLLMENKGRILPRALLLEKMWDARGEFVNDNTLTVAVKRLREKLGGASCIVTIRGIGYRMEEKG